MLKAVWGWYIDGEHIHDACHMVFEGLAHMVVGMQAVVIMDLGDDVREEQSAPPALALAPKFSRYRVLYTLYIAIGYKVEFPVLDGPFLQQTHEF